MKYSENPAHLYIDISNKSADLQYSVMYRVHLLVSKDRSWPESCCLYQQVVLYVVIGKDSHAGFTVTITITSVNTIIHSLFINPRKAH